MDDNAIPIARSELERRFKNLVENIPGLVVYLDVVQPDDPGARCPSTSALRSSSCWATPARRG